jgi:hypothetical protein
MDAERLAPRLGVAACLALLALVAAPYAVLDPAQVGAYYAAGALGPPLSAAAAAVVLMALASGAADRADAPTVAGVALVLGLVAAGGVTEWALATGDAVGPELDGHPAALTAVAAAIPAAAAWYARAVLSKGP